MDKLLNEFTVNRPIDETWNVLTDVERIAPCMPGAALEEIEGDVFRGVVKVKLGAISTAFKGQANFIERDDAAHRAVLKGEGRDTTGKGNASALITAKLESIDERTTKCYVETDLHITGKVAQFGRGVLADVSAKILKQFVDCLEHDVLATPEETVTAVAAAGAAVDGPAAPAIPAPTSTADAAEPVKPAVRKIEYKPTEPVDLLGTAGAPVVKRAAPAVAILFLLVWLLRRRKKS